MKYLLLLLILSGCATASTDKRVWEKVCIDQSNHPNKKCFEYTR